MTRHRWRIAACTLALIASTPPASAQAPAAAPTAGVDVTLDAARLDTIDRYVTAEMARQRIPGLTLGIYHHGCPVYTRGYGLADLEWRVPMAADTRLQTGSLGKQFVAAAILRLAEQGKLDVDASLSRYFPEAPARLRPITLAHLLSHTSGLGVYDTPERTKPGGPFDYHADFTEAQLAAKILALPPDFKVGTDWRYNNTNYVLLGILIQRVTGKPYGDYLRDAFFAPLGMRDTRVISDTDVIDRRASGYEIKGGVVRNQEWVSATFNATADGTLYTTVEDMARWDRALEAGSVLSRASLARMWTPVKLADGTVNKTGYGFGWWIDAIDGHRRIEHGGAWQGFASQMTRFPEDGWSVAVFANLDAGHARPGNIANVVAGLVLPALMPKVATPLADDDPARAERLRALLLRATAGQDIADAFDPIVGYKFDSADAAELRAGLPMDWATAPLVLVRRSDETGGAVRYRYRLGPTGNTRLLSATIKPSGKLTGFTVQPDPDNR